MYNSWHTGTVRECSGKQSYCQEEGEEVGEGRAEGQQLEMDFQYRPEGEMTQNGFSWWLLRSRYFIFWPNMEGQGAGGQRVKAL